MDSIYIDIHTHHPKPDRTDVITVGNILMQEAHRYTPAVGYYSIGLHPWESETVNLDRQLFIDMIARPEIIAVGECGIDRLRGADLKKQTSLFIQQAEIAEEYQKPLFIHCVRAWQEIIALKDEIRPKVPWMVHGYRGKARVAGQLLERGFLLSFGQNIHWMNPVLSSILKGTPDERLFLETDDSTQPIEDIYQVAAKIKSLSLIELKTRLANNFETIFGLHGTSRVAAAD